MDITIENRQKKSLAQFLNDHAAAGWLSILFVLCLELLTEKLFSAEKSGLLISGIRAGEILLSVILVYFSAALFIEKKVLRREKILFKSCTSKASFLLAVLTQFMLAASFFLFFYFLLGETQDPVRLITLIPVSAACGMLCFTTDISRRIAGLVPWIGYILAVVYFYYVLSVHGYTNWSEASRLTAGLVHPVAVRWIRILGMFLLIYQLRTDLRKGILTGTAMLILFYAHRQGTYPLLIEFTGIVMLSSLLKGPRVSAKVFLGAMTAYTAFLLIGCQTGWVTNFQMQFPYGRPSWTWGLAHTNLTALLLMTILLLVWYLWLREKPVLTFLVFEASAAGIWFLTYCRTVVAIAAIFPVIVFAGAFVNRLKKPKLWSLLAYTPLLFAAISIFLMSQYPQMGQMGLDNNFTLRFAIPYSAIHDYGLYWIRSSVPRLFIVDNVFLHLLVYYGIIPAVVVPVLMTFVSLKYYRNRQWAELTLVTAMMIYSLMENAVIHLPFGFAFLLSLPAGQEKWTPGWFRKSAEKVDEARTAARKEVQSLPAKREKASWTRGLAAAAACYLMLCLGFYWIVAEDWSQTSVVTDAVNQDILLPEIMEGNEIRQTLSVQADKLQRLDLRVKAAPAEGDERTIDFGLLDGDATLWEKSVRLTEVPEGGLLQLTVEDLPEISRGKQLTLRVRGNGGAALWAGTTRTAGKVTVDAVTGEKLTVGGQDQPGELTMSQWGVNHLPYSRHYWPVALILGLVLLAAAVVLHLLEKSGKTTLVSRAGVLIRQYEYLLKTLVIRDFKVRYKASALGVVWSFLNPLLMTMVYLFVFSTLFRSNIQHFPVYLLSGIVLFNYFSEATNLGMQSIVGNAGLITKVYMPKYIFPISKAISSAINLVISLIPMLIMMAITGVPFHKSLFLLPVVILFIVVFCIGVSLILSTIMVFFRDIQFLWGIVVTILNFCSPIFYPESIIPPQFITIYHLNPLYQYLFFMRTIVTGGISPNPITYLYCALASGLALAVGLFVFRKSQSKFVLHL